MSKQIKDTRGYVLSNRFIYGSFTAAFIALHSGAPLWKAILIGFMEWFFVIGYLINRFL